ncbi:MAG TPA: glycerol-3-phosphate dehydrogenase/oxidase [Burkholderiales bacterium]
MNRPELLHRLSAQSSWDLVVIGGGATGLGIALDAAVRGFSVALVEAGDFAAGTSSRTTKLVHGGVRYLAQGNFHLVKEGLQERSLLLANAPHLAQPIPFVMPAYRWWDKAWYGMGLRLYDALAGKSRLGKTEFLGAYETQRRVPTIERQGLRGSVQYWDGQFDDARLAIALARTAAHHGACVVNYCVAVGVLREDDAIAGVAVRDMETGARLELRSRCVVNATGVWVDQVRRFDQHNAPRMVEPSQGIHLVVDGSFLPAARALLIPHTSDGRVLFAIPWLGSLLLGTTDTPRKDIVEEPRPTDEEVDFILREIGRYLHKPPTRANVRSAWAGLRPLVKPVDARGKRTRTLSREHAVVVSDTGLVTVTGGKWTTYRAMAEDVLEACFEKSLLPWKEGGVTRDLRLVGAPESSHVSLSAAPGLHLYGTDADVVHALRGGDLELAPGLTTAMVRFAVREEFARTVEDVLARRSRLLFLDAAKAAKLAHPVAAIMKEELGAEFDAEKSARDFERLADGYRLT